MSDRPKGPLGIDPLHFSTFMFVVLVAFVLYLLLPRGIRKHYFGAYPKRHAWSARPKARNNHGRPAGGGMVRITHTQKKNELLVFTSLTRSGSFSLVP